jgi:apolipoprotein N-acyltransferase
MSTQTLGATLPIQDVRREKDAHRVHPAVLGVSAALLFWLSFPPASWSWLAWIALTPLFLLVRSDRSVWTIYSSAWLGGLVFWLLAIQWVQLTDPTAWLAWLVMALFLSFWWPAFLLVARLAIRTLRLPMMFAAPVVWVALEFVRAFVLTGFPWYYLAHSQYQYVYLIQISDFAGALGVSFVLAMANACLAELLARPRLMTARGAQLAPAQIGRLVILALALTSTLAYGVFRISTAQFRPGPRLALLQSNIKQEYKANRSPEEVLAVYSALVEKAVRKVPAPDLIVWPETSYPFGFVAIDKSLDPATLQKQIKTIDRKGTVKAWLNKLEVTDAVLHGWVDQIRIPMLIGSLYYDFQREGLRRFNSAILFEPGTARVQTYHKLHLVPFGEYVPLIQTFPWLTALTPYRGSGHIPSLSFGDEPMWFNWKDVQFATAICFEDTVPHVVRRFFAETKDSRQPDFLINISNDGWFQWSEELDMHLAASVFRAVENRVPLARAVNTGISALIDGNGRIYERLPKNTQGVLDSIVRLDDRTSLYSAWGDWPGQACLLITLVVIPLGAGCGFSGRMRRNAKPDDSGSLPRPN